jgi:hypothetical protein
MHGTLLLHARAYTSAYTSLCPGWFRRLGVKLQVRLHTLLFSQEEERELHTPHARSWNLLRGCGRLHARPLTGGFRHSSSTPLRSSSLGPPPVYFPGTCMRCMRPRRICRSGLVSGPRPGVCSGVCRCLHACTRTSVRCTQGALGRASQAPPDATPAEPTPPKRESV